MGNIRHCLGRERFYRHKMGHLGAILLALMAALALFASYLGQYDPAATNLTLVRQPPSGLHLLGTDELGRDVLSRLLYGAKVSLLVGIASVLLSTTLGVTYGIVSGYLGGRIDSVMMRLVDGLLSLPTLVLVIAFQALGQQGLWNVILVIACTSWMQTARLVRTEFMSIKQRPFVDAARVLGTSDWQIIIRHILPHCLASVVVMATINVGHAIMTEAALSFLGLGIPPYQPSWGNMLMGGQRTMLAGAWWITVFPGLAIVVTVLAINFIGDALRDSLDPRTAMRYTRKRAL